MTIRYAFRPRQRLSMSGGTVVLKTLPRKGIVGITGPAGSGKSTLSDRIHEQIPDSVVYHIDQRFIGDSQYRKELLSRKSKGDIYEYLDTCNQFNWWDWDAVSCDIESLSSGRVVTVPSAYNRESGQSEGNVILVPSGLIIVEGAILGSLPILSMMNLIIFVTSCPEMRLSRLAEKDRGRRSYMETIHRMTITDYSEKAYYKRTLSLVSDRITFVDQDYNICPGTLEEYVSADPVAVCVPAVI